MRPLVYFKILAPGEHLSAPWKRAWKRFLPRVYPNVVHQLVLGLEGSPVPRTIFPETRVRRALRAPHVVHSQMCYNILHASEMLSTGFPCGLLWINPTALHLLLDGLTHIAKKGRRVYGPIAGMMVRYAHMMGVIEVRRMAMLMSCRLIHHLMVRRHLRRGLKQHGITRCWLWGREIVVIPSQQEISCSVTWMLSVPVCLGWMIVMIMWTVHCIILLFETVRC